MPSAGYLIGPARGDIRWLPSTDGRPHRDPPRPEPGPWPWSAAVAGLAEAASIKKIAASLPAGDLRSQLEAGASRSIDRILDEWCGARGTWPGPGPPPWSIAIAGQLAAMASSHPAGLLRDELLRIAGQALLRPFGRQQKGTGERPGAADQLDGHGTGVCPAAAPRMDAAASSPRKVTDH